MKVYPSPCTKCESDKLRYIEDIQLFGVNMSFISLSEVKFFIFYECQCRRHE